MREGYRDRHETKLECRDGTSDDEYRVQRHNEGEMQGDGDPRDSGFIPFKQAAGL